MSEQRISPNDELKKLVEAIYNLIPSRNMLSQLIMLLPMKFETLKEMYPELIEDYEYWTMLSSTLGIYITSDMEVSCADMCIHIRDFIIDIFDHLKDGKVRATISMMTGMKILDPRLEWLEVRIKAAIEHASIGTIAKKVLTLLITGVRATVEELANKLNIDKGVLDECINILRTLKLVDINSEKKIYLQLSYDEARYIPYLKKLLEEKSVGENQL